MDRDKILVTGASGFIGCGLIDRLVRQGSAVIAVMRRDSPLPPSWLDNRLIEIVRIDDLATADFNSGPLADALGSVRSVVHLAGLAHIATADGARAEQEFRRANVTATENLVLGALKHPIRSFVFLSSLAAITENHTDIVIDDRTNAPPRSDYGRSKKEAEAVVRQLPRNGLFAVSLRPPLVVGSVARGNWSALQRLASSGLPLPFAGLHNARSFVSRDTLIEAIKLLCMKDHSPDLSGEYCIADSEHMTVKDIIRALRDGMKKPPRLFYCPPALFDLLGALAGRRRQFAGLTGPLIVDSYRFSATFGNPQKIALPDAIRKSGADYVLKRSSDRR